MEVGNSDTSEVAGREMPFVQDQGTTLSRYHHHPCQCSPNYCDSLAGRGSKRPDVYCNACDSVSPPSTAARLLLTVMHHARREWKLALVKRTSVASDLNLKQGWGRHVPNNSRSTHTPMFTGTCIFFCVFCSKVEVPLDRRF